MTDALAPDPSMVGGVPKPPLAFLPAPVELFQARARRFAFLAQTSELAPYLGFLAELSRLQARLAAMLPPVVPVARARMLDAARGAMPPIDRLGLVANAGRAADAELLAEPALVADARPVAETRPVDDAGLAATLHAVLESAAALAMPEPARRALDAVGAADDGDRRWLLANVLGDRIPADGAAPHLFAAAAVQIHLARLAATLDADALVPVHVGICPACGGRPVSSMVMGRQGVENVRYAVCAGCATQWNEVRVKCLCCGSTKGISYSSVGVAEATVKAEVCAECRGWVKIFHQTRNPSLDPVADDVGSLGLDILMKDTGFRRGGFNPYLVGY